MRQGDLNLIVSYAEGVKRNVLEAKSRARPETGTVAARQREFIEESIRIAEAMLERLRAL